MAAEHRYGGTHVTSSRHHTIRMPKKLLTATKREQKGSRKLENPSRVIWIPDHACWTKHIKIHDLTSNQLDLGHGEWKNCRNARKAAKVMQDQLDANPPLWTIEKQGLFKSMNIYEGDIQNNAREEWNPVCEWNQARWEYGITRFTFSESSPRKPLSALDLSSTRANDVPNAIPPSTLHQSYPTHNLTMKRITRLNVCDRSESFVIESQQYIWRWDNIWSPCQLTLYKIYDSFGNSTPVARYRGQIPFFKAAGLLTVDEKEVNLFVAVMTCCAMVRKDLKRQN